MTLHPYNLVTQVTACNTPWDEPYEPNDEEPTVRTTTIDPLLDKKHIPAGAIVRNNKISIVSQYISKHA
jgi:hypothetical protein